MALSTLLSEEGLTINLVVQIGDTYFADFDPDSDPGSLLTMSDGLLGQVTLPAPSVDVLRGDVNIPTVSFQLADVLGEVTDWYGEQNNAVYGQDVIVWAGAIDQSQAFPADYTKIATCKLKKATKEGAFWNFECVDVVERADVPAFQTVTKLNGDHSDVITTLTVDSTTDFPSSGYLKIGSEYVSYTGKTSTTFTTVTRAALASEAADHDSETEVKIVTALQGNALELALQLLVSAGGGGSYDLLDDGAAIDEDLIDVDAFEDFVDDFDDFQMTIYVSEIDSILNLIAQEILLPYGLRIISKDGTISVAQINVFDATVSALTIDETTIAGIPTVKIDADEVVNDILFKWDYSVANDVFTQQAQYEDTDSQTRYGTRPQHVFEFHSSITNGGTLFDLTQSKLLARFGQALATITAQVDRVGFLSSPGDDIRLVHANLPQPGGGLGHDAFMELMATTRSQDGFVQFTLQYPSYSNYRLGIIAPSPLISSITSQSVFTVESGQGKYYREGYVLRIWSGTAYLADTVRTITDVTGDTLTVTPAWTTTLTTSMRIKFADYDDCSDEQVIVYAFIGATDTEQVIAKDSSSVDQNVIAKDSSSVDQNLIAYTPDTFSTFTDGKRSFQIVP
jgi:hypothetical protein